MKKSISSEGRIIEYELTRKRVKNMNLRLRSDGSVSVSAPYFVSQGQIDRFVAKHAERILSSLEKLRQNTDIARHSRHSFTLRGCSVPIYCSQGSRNKAEYAGEAVLLTLKDGADEESRTRMLDKLLRQLAINWVTESSERIYPVFRSMGVSKPEIKFRKMKSRWGSCHWEKGSLSFNTALAHVPQECIDYVVMHEYCHFIRPDHSPAFHQLMTNLMPDWKERKKILEKYSSLL